jgi:FemAB-related protein (PEP-CTERM system-associated)
MELSVRAEVQPADWDEYVLRAAGATICHLSGWLDSVQRTWGRTPFRLVARRGPSIVGVLPLLHLRSWLFGSMLVSTPTAIYGGPLASDDVAREALMAEARRLANRLGVDYLEVRHPSPVAGLPGDDDGFHQQHLYVTFERPIAESPDALLASLPKKIRYQVRRGVDSGLQAKLGRDELLDDFYRVYATNMRNLGTPVYPRRLFAEFLRAFPTASDILVIRQGERLAGATLNFYFRDTVLPHYGCACADLHQTGVSAFMYWRLMQSAAVRGHRHFDFGRSKVGSGSWAFKRGWRMHERPLGYRYLLVRARQMPNLNPTNPRYGLAIRVWKRLPLAITNALGPVLVRNIP